MHNRMAFPVEECVRYTHLKEKITAIIPTSNARIECLLWSVFSLLLRNSPDGMLEHICVNINGPDERTGNTEIQDIKQKFLEDLRDVEWFHNNSIKRRQMPLTVIRVWSRVGYSQAFEMALSWIHTDGYLLMHDDVIVTNQNWTSELKEKFYTDPEVALAYTPTLLGCNCDSSVHRGMYLLRLPQLETTFLVCKKEWIMKAGASFTGYHIPDDENFLQFDLSELPDFVQYYKDKNLMPIDIQNYELYNFVRQEVGAWLFYNLTQLNAKFVKLEDNNIIHFGQMSHTGISEEVKNTFVEVHKDEIAKLEREILAHPVYSKLYEKYIPGGPCYA